MHFLRRFDYFTKTKEEFDSSTSIGGFFSLVALAVCLLFGLLNYSKDWNHFLYFGA